MLRTPLHPLKKTKSWLQPNMTVQRHFSSSDQELRFQIPCAVCVDNNTVVKCDFSESVSADSTCLSLWQS